MIPVEIMRLLKTQHVKLDHARWSQETFGPVGPVGPLKHLLLEVQELLEALEKSGGGPSTSALKELSDCQLLLWDAQWRMGATDAMLLSSLTATMAMNKARFWPEPKDGEPRLHVKEPNPAPTPGSSPESASEG